jgi:hypothetical protein
MMQDRFSAQLRGHLLRTADTRPADGQLAAIDELVAVTAQRHPLVARLPWSRGRINPFPSVAMRYALIAVGLIIVMVAAALAAGFGPTRRTVFEGTWASIDVADGSRQTLVVGAGTSPPVHFVDEFATGAACLADKVKVFTMDGTGTIVDDRMLVEWPDGGGCGLTTVFVGPGAYVHDEASDTITDGDDSTWTRVQGGPVSPTVQPSNVVATPAPRPSELRPSPHPGESTFTSTIHGISIDYPSTWQTRPATEPWTGGPLDFDSLAADVIFHPALRDGLYLLVASQPYGALTQDAWGDRVLAWTCPDGIHDFGTWRVDGTNAEHGGPCNSGVLVFTDYRGYLIRLVVSSNEPGLAQTYDWEWLKGRLETVDLRPARSAEDSECVEYREGGTYRQAVDPLTVTATLPAGTDNGWWSASRIVFAVGSQPCLFGPAIRLEVSGPARLFSDACKWRDSSVEVGSHDDAYATLSQNGLETTPSTDVTLGGYPASRFEISVPEGFDLTRCDAGQLWLWAAGPGRDALISPDETVRVYLVDVDGLTLGVTATYSPGDERLPAHMAELDAILASMRIEPQ